MKCPKCGCGYLKFETRSAGTLSRTNYYRTGVKSSWFVPSGRRTYKSKKNYTSVAVCQNCGYCYDTKAAAERQGCLYILGFLFLPIGLSVWFYKTPWVKLDKKYRVAIIVAFWVILYTALYIFGQTVGAE